MADTIANMTKEEFARILSNVVEEKLIELFGDPDDGLLMKERMRKRLLRQRKSVLAGERGEDFEAAVKRLVVK